MALPASRLPVAYRRDHARRRCLAHMTTPDAPTAMTPEEFLARDNRALRAAGGKLAEAALYVVHNYDGLHRLSLAVSEWSQTVADEGGRPHGQPLRDPTAELVEALVGVLNGGVIDEAAGLVSVDLTAYNAAVDALARHRGEQS